MGLSFAWRWHHLHACAGVGILGEFAKVSTQIAACVFIALSALNICLGVMQQDQTSAHIERVEP
jgi:hypothetical protein